MHITHTRIDIDKTRAAWPGGSFLPAYVFPRKDKEKWIVLDAPYVIGEEPSFALTASDEYIRIPLFSYQLSPVGDVALSFMLQFGLSFANHIGTGIRNLNIVSGHPVELVYSDKNLTHMNCWLGFAFVPTE